MIVPQQLFCQKLIFIQVVKRRLQMWKRQSIMLIKIIKNWQLLECNKALNEAKSYVQMKYTDINAMIQKTLGIIFTVLELYPKRFWWSNVLYRVFGLINQPYIMLYTILVKLFISTDMKMFALAHLDFTCPMSQLFM